MHTVQISFGHLKALGGSGGLFEHAERNRPLLQHGYCLDDNGRALVVIARAASCGIEFPPELRDRCLDFVTSARRRNWRFRRGWDGSWKSMKSDDAVGRALWGLGAATAEWPEPGGKQRARATLGESLGFTSPFWHPPAYTLLGLHAAHQADPDGPWEAAAARLSSLLPRPQTGLWMWPEPRLRYDNARLPEAMLAAGELLDDSRLMAEGVRLLEWLVETETVEGHFSFTPAGGRGPGGAQPAYDQQPLEAWAMADACLRAAAITGDRSWLSVAGTAVSWFMGNNDQGVPLYDPHTGGCYDGLTSSGVNLNQGAESTLSALGALLGLLCFGA
ncbi:MAG TPA: glycosyltransferase [Acidimicrobiia bacterium]|nr:glycosyltransferase [Acidimicrobiia bacterium]